MHSIELLHKTFEEKLPSIHKNRLKSLMIVRKAVIIDSKVYLTGLGKARINKYNFQSYSDKKLWVSLISS
jgi:hypothetical protein